MELVEGLTLADRIARGPIPLDEALPIAAQITEALECAHDQGIIHRDLKPANLKVRPDGTVKVLDFGLAKAMEGAGAAGKPGVAAGSASMSPTITTPAMTHAGIILGTAAYMSPEQARGKAVDKRADIWAFGVVFYEMLTGKRAFDGQETTDILASVIKDDPPIDALPADTPFLIKRLLRHCLNKDPRQRLGDIRDARIEISEARSVPALEHAFPAKGARARRERFAWIAVGVSAALIAGVAGLFAVGAIRLREAPVEAPTVRFTIAPPPGVAIVGKPVVSPDGRYIAFAGTDGTLWIRTFDGLSMQKLPGTEGATQPFWSPDSRSIAFAAAGKLKKIDVAGGPVLTLSDIGISLGGTWSADGVILLTTLAGPTTCSNAGCLQRIAATGGAPVAVVPNLPPQDLNARVPEFLPDGQHFIYLVDRPGGAHAIKAAALGEAATTELVTNVDSNGVYAPPGVLLFLRGRTLMEQRFNPRDLKVEGEAVPVAEGVGLNVFGVGLFSVSQTGSLVYTTLAVADKSRLVWVDRKGGVVPLALPPGAYGAPGLSPDGRQIALSITDASGTHIWVYDILRGTLGKRTFEGINNFPLWTPDGQSVVFSRGPNMVGPIMRVRADGSGSAETLVPDEQRPGSKIPASWSPDGTQLSFQNGNDVFVREKDGALTPALTSVSREIEGRFAPAGHWLAYNSNETGRPEVYVQSWPTGNGKWQISTDGGAQPMWSPRGNELFYKSGNEMMVADVDTGATFKAGVPRVLFAMPMPERSPGDPARFIVSPDASRFLVLTTVPNDSAPVMPPLNVVLNWRATRASK